MLVVAVSSHPVIAKLGKVGIAQLLPHLISKMHKLIIQTVQLCLIVLIPLSLRLPSGQSSGIILVIFKGRHLGNGVDFSFKGNLRTGQKLFIGGGQFIFLLHHGDDFRGKCL